MHRATELLTKLLFFLLQVLEFFLPSRTQQKGNRFHILVSVLTSDRLNCSQLELLMFLSGNAGMWQQGWGWRGEMHLRLEHAQMRPLPLQERREGESSSQMGHLSLMPANCMQNQAIAGLQTCSKGRGSKAESQIWDAEKLHSFLCYWSYLGQEQSSHRGKHPTGSYQKPSYLVGHKIRPALQSAVTQSRKKNPWVSWI